MKKSIIWACGLLLVGAACQTESLDIQRTFPFQLEIDAFPTSIPWQRPISVGFGVKPDYITTTNSYTFTWQIAAPQEGVLWLNNKLVNAGSKIVVAANRSRLLSDTLTYMPIDSGSHTLTFRVFDLLGQAKDTTFTVTAVK